MAKRVKTAQGQDRESAGAILELLVADFETAHRCQVTVHDHWSRLVDASGRPFFVDRALHRPACCRFRRDGRRDYNDRCVEHCKRRMMKLSQERRTPFPCDCWKGVRELIVPVYDGERLLATLYFGAFRGGRPEASARLPASYATLLEALEPLDDAAADRLGRLARGLVYSILHLYERERRAVAPADDRARRVLEFVRDHAHRPVGLEALAEHLGLSLSRTGHLFQELFGRRFGDFLNEERIRRALRILEDPDVSIAEAAARSGFASEVNFNRVFSVKTGLTPRAYRRSVESRPRREALRAAPELP